MAYREGAAPSRVFYGWWMAAAFSLILFISTGIRFAVVPFLKPVVDDLGLARGSFSPVISLSRFLVDLSGGYGFAFAVSCGLLLLRARLSLTINVAGRLQARSLLLPAAGGR